MKSTDPGVTAFSYINNSVSASYGNGFPILNLNGNREGLQHSMISVAGVDPNVPIQMIKPGGGCTAMVGDGFGNQWKASSLRRSIVITPSNYNFYYSYAVVMQNPNHSQTDQPYFRIRLYDQNNQSIDCAKYDVYAGNGDPDWKVKGNGANTLNYMDWTSAFIPLQAYIGQTLTIEFTTGDCTQGGHACYAYIEGECDQPTQLSDTATCVGHPVTITAPAGAKTYLWSTGETTQAISVEKKGEYWVRMEGTAGGCYAYDTVHVGTYDISTAIFSVDTACIGNATHFTDHSLPSNSLQSWKWDFQNMGANNSTSQNSSHTYASAGNYNAKLTITNTHGCIDDTVMQVFVAPKPMASFSSNLVCMGDSTSFTNQSTGIITTYKWDFLNNNQHISALQNPKYKYGAVSTAKLKVTTQFGCADSITHPIAFNPLPVAAFTQTNVCLPDAVPFNSSTSTVSSGSIAQWNWTFGDGSTDNTQNPSHAYSSFGSKTVKLKVTSDLGCKDSITKTVTVFEKPTINFTVNNVCDKISTTLSNTSTLASAATYSTWNWDILNDGSTEYTTQNAAHLFSSAGTYRILLRGTTNEGCTDTLSKSVTIYPLPHADFTSKNVCAGKATPYTDKSTGTIAQWKWDFTNNNSVDNNTQNPSFTFPARGNYSTKLKVVSDKGCTDSITKSLVVNPLPKAAFSAADICFPMPVNFNNSSTVSPGNITYQKWKFSNSEADTSNNFNPSKSYPSSGNYNVKLFVRTDSACVDSITKPIVYFEKPKVDFNLMNGCATTNTSFTNTSILNTSTFSSWKWDIDNNLSTDYTTKNATHKYAQPNTYTIQLIGVSAQGCADTATKQITVFPLPIADFTPLAACVSDSISFKEGSTVSSGSISNYQWNFNDGKTSTLKDVKNKFSSEGIKTVRLIVTTDKNCKDTIDKTVNVFPLPSPQFTALEVCLNNNTTLNNTSTISSNITPNQITQYLWKFDDNQTSSLANAQHLFSSPGIHKVTLVLTSNNNCVDSISKNVNVNPLPIAKFISTKPAGCAEWCVDFTNQSTITSGSILSYQWNFGEGSTSPLVNPKNCFQNTGTSPATFDISLKVTSDKGCSKDTLIPAMITAYPITKADFNFTPGELDENNNEVHFTNASWGENSWLWNFGDSTFSGFENPSHKYVSTGDHYITLKVNNAYNCADSITKKIHSKPVYSYYIPNVFTPNGDGINDRFYIYTYNIIDYKLYIFNRWGEHIFTSYDMNEGWHGIYGGELVQIDTYVYKAYLTDIFGEVHEEVGIVSCIR